MPNNIRKIVHEDELQEGIKKGLEELYLVAKAAYGPGGGVALIEGNYGDPLASRDGVSNLQKVHLEDPIQNMAARIAVQASKQNNLHVGDGTTAVVILSYHLYNAARKLLSGGFSRREVVGLLQDSAGKVDSYIDKLTISANGSMLINVAEIASGDELIGQLIADTIEEVGADGGITVEDFEGAGTFADSVEGFFFQKGFTNVNLTNDPSNLESRYDDDAYIFITEKRMATVSDMAPILDKIIGKGIKDLLIVGEVLEEAQQVLLVARLKGLITTTVVDAPVYAGARSLFLDDLALVTGGQVFPAGANPNEFEPEMLGGAERIVVTGNTTSIEGREGSLEDILGRIAALKEQLEESTNETDKEALKARISRLTGKMAIIRVGGATEVEQKEKKLRVQDAVCAVQAAARGGVVPGGGVALALYPDKELDSVYTSPFIDLVENTGANASKGLAFLDFKKPWKGYDLNNMDAGIVDLLEAGVVDPALVVKESVQNAVSVVTKLITAVVGLPYLDRDEKHG